MTTDPRTIWARLRAAGVRWHEGMRTRGGWRCVDAEGVHAWVDDGLLAEVRRLAGAPGLCVVGPTEGEALIAALVHLTGVEVTR